MALSFRPLAELSSGHHSAPPRVCRPPFILLLDLEHCLDGDSLPIVAFGREFPQIIALGENMHMQMPHGVCRVRVKRIFEIIRLAPEEAFAQRFKVFLQHRQEALAGLGVRVFGCQDVVLFVESRAHAFEKLR